MANFLVCMDGLEYSVEIDYTPAQRGTWFDPPLDSEIDILEVINDDGEDVYSSLSKDQLDEIEVLIQEQINERGNE